MYTLVNIQKTIWKDPPCSMGQSTIYGHFQLQTVSLPKGISTNPHSEPSCKPTYLSMEHQFATQYLTLCNTSHNLTHPHIYCGINFDRTQYVRPWSYDIQTDSNWHLPWHIVIQFLWHQPDMKSDIYSDIHFGMWFLLANGPWNMFSQTFWHQPGHVDMLHICILFPDMYPANNADISEMAAFKIIMIFLTG